jgi:WD40 repeat protein
MARSYSGMSLSLAVNATGNKLISGDNEGILKFWDVESGECLKTLSSIPKAFRTLAFNSDGNLLASSGDDRKIRLWDINIARCTSTISAHAMAVWHVAFPPQGDLLASGSIDSTVKLWNISDSAYLASSSNDLTVRLWDVNTWKCMRVLTGHISLVTGIAYHPASQRQLLASCSHDDTIRGIQLLANVSRCCDRSGFMRG